MDIENFINKLHIQSMYGVNKWMSVWLVIRKQGNAWANKCVRGGLSIKDEQV